MHHAYIDTHSSIDSILHKIDPRVKLLSLVAFILYIIFTPAGAYEVFALYGALIAFLIFISRIPVGFILKRSLVIVPFVLLIAVFIPFVNDSSVSSTVLWGSFKASTIHGRWELFYAILCRAYLAILCMILFMNSTKFRDYLRALESLRFPRLIIMILSFMYRYVFVIQDELMMMWQAKNARTVSRRRWLNVRALTNMLGVLFIRTYEKAENVYLAMCSRGFTGRIDTVNYFKINRRDICFLLILMVLLTGIRMVKV